MDDTYRINVAKTEFREAHNTGDVERLLAVYHSEGFKDMSEAGPSKYGPAALLRLREQASRLFADYSVKLTPIIIEIVFLGDKAYDYGWHEFTLTPKNGGEPTRRRERYFELWDKHADGNWKISLQINNTDVREGLKGVASHWFLSEEHSGTAYN